MSDGGNGIHQLAIGGGDEGGGGHGDPHDGDRPIMAIAGRNNVYITRRNGSILVKSNNVVVPTFSGSNLNSFFYLQFHKAIRRLIYNHGEDGELLFDILGGVEKCGANVFIDEQFEELVRQFPRVAEYNRAIMSVLFNYTTGAAKGMVEHAVEHGFDVWRRLYQHYFFFAEDLQQN